ncbi:MAG: hypothetical protein MJA27_16040 [Pseudanabaenales cyanobacterium]|nr:hypothetical protein [Pseudanabaenales cyanobacterium]
MGRDAWSQEAKHFAAILCLIRDLGNFEGFLSSKSFRQKKIYAYLFGLSFRKYIVDFPQK